MKKEKTKAPEASGIPVHCSHSAIVDIEEAVPNPRNPNKHPDKQIAMLAKIIRQQGWRNPVVISDRSGFVVKGHGRVEAALLLQVATIPVDVQHYETEAEEWSDMMADNRIAELAEIDNSVLKDLLEELDTGDWDMDITGFDVDALEDLMTQTIPEEDEVPEPPAEPTSVLGQVWSLGSHRLMCGDSTSEKDVSLLMDGEKVSVIHADPPYGMGKEAEGVLNDNIYNEKLDAFQMAWWAAFRTHAADNASVYVWGNAPDLWRLWYLGGLQDSEQLELRNEIVWDKKCIPGMASDLMTQYPEASERCLFIQIGQQFIENINSDDFPEQWEPLRAYMSNAAVSAGISSRDIKLLCECQMWGHWFTTSQFTLISEKHYNTVQGEYPKHFTRSWESLKSEWDSVKDVVNGKLRAMRSYFDNAHESMIDVWNFPRVIGEERHNHATPKPVAMMARAIKSSCPKGGAVAEPFGGSGTTLIACEQLDRSCYMMELDPRYCDVIIARWETLTGNKAELIDA